SHTGLFGMGFLQSEPIKKEVLIGVILPLTGTSADGGTRMKEGLELAQKQINNDSNVQTKVRLIYEDSQYNPELAVTSAKKLIEADGVFFIIGTYGSSEVLAVAPVIESKKVILMVPGAGASQITNAGDYVFRVAPTTKLETEFFARFLARRIGANPLCIISLNTEMGVSYVNDLSNIYPKLGGHMGSVQYFSISEKDFAPYLLNIKNADLNNVLIIGNRKQTGMILKQAKELGMNYIFFGSSFSEGQELLDTADGAAEGMIYPYSFDDNSNSPFQKIFQNSFFQSYGRKSEVFSAEAYDSLMIISNCFEKSGVEVNTVKNCLYSAQNYQGVSGEISFDANGDVSKPFILKTMRNGMFTKLDES
ncbi:MAG: ABC transporter substrate-binding protein, partial [Candidatus Diapherotrites archaeon]|nr:ABC transporter substrate-binding protein [Candidatus Diapherotrites archaeon]